MICLEDIGESLLHPCPTLFVLRHNKHLDTWGIIVQPNSTCALSSIPYFWDTDSLSSLLLVFSFSMLSVFLLMLISWEPKGLGLLLCFCPPSPRLGRRKTVIHHATEVISHSHLGTKEMPGQEYLPSSQSLSFHYEFQLFFSGTQMFLAYLTLLMKNSI